MKKGVFLFLWIAFFLPAPTLAQDTVADSVAIKLQDWNTEVLENKLQTAQEDTTKVILLNELSWRSAFSQPEKGLSYFRQSLALSQKLNYKKGIAYAYSNAAWCQTTLGNYHYALQLALKSLPLFEDLNEKERLAWVYLTLADIYRDFGDLEKALQMAQQSIKGYNELHISARVPLAVAGSIYELQNRLDSALIYVHKAQALDKRDNSGKWGWIQILLGNIYRKKKEYDLALHYYRTALPRTIAVNVKKDIVETYTGMALVHQGMGQLDSSIYYANEVIRNWRSISYQKGVLSAYNILSNAYKIKNAKDSTIKYLELSTALNRKLFNLEKQRDIQNLAFSEQMRLEAVEKERQQFRNRLKLYALLTIGIVLSGMGLLLWRHKQQREKANLLLQKQKQETEQERLKANLEIKQIESDRLRELDMIKSRFFSNITHEFRTPLSLILPPTEQLLQEVTEPQQRRRLSLIKQNAGQLLRLINQLLDFTKIESGNMTVIDSRGDLTAFVEQIIDSFRPAVQEKGIALEYDSQLNAEERIFDADKWSKIVYNLLSNALKFTPTAGKILVKLKQQEDPQHISEMVVLIISDTGIGISANKQEHIFDRFYQVDDSRTRAYEGSGIGLALVKELVEVLKGIISVDSNPGQGTTFTVAIPVRKALVTSDTPVPQVESPVLKATHLVDKPQEKQISPILPPEAPLVLVVEDNADLREFITEELSSTYRVLTAGHGEEGWKLVQQELPDIVISDVMMPVMDGYALTECIKTDLITNHIAVILLTAKATQENKVAGLLQGADDYLTKPFNLEELKLRLRNLLDHQQKLRQHYQQQLDTPQTELPIKTVENKFLQTLYQTIEEQLDNSKFDVDSLAEAAAMSRRTLYRKIATLTGLTPNEVIRNYRLLRASQLLQAGHAVSQVAYQVGFESPSYFGQCFKEKYQITPSEYCQQHLAQT